MVIGLYGILYWEVARVPERGWLLAAVGLLGKIIGPVGLALSIWNRTWPKSTIVLCVTNDFIWWIPFSIYLFDSWGMRSVPSAVAGGSIDIETESRSSRPDVIG